MKTDEKYITEERNLKRLQVACFARIHRQLLQDTEFDFVYEPFVEMVTVQIRGQIWTEPLGVHELSYPATWWQMFKQDIVPHWFQRIFPVKQTTVKLEVRVLYPGFKPFREPSTIKFLPWEEDDDDQG